MDAECISETNVLADGKQSDTVLVTSGVALGEFVLLVLNRTMAVDGDGAAKNTKWSEVALIDEFANDLREASEIERRGGLDEHGLKPSVGAFSEEDLV